MSWNILRQALKNKDMQKRMLIVIALVIAYRLLAFVPIPLAEPSQLRQLIESQFSSQQLLGFIDLLSGGALSNFSIVLMGLGPYINASIIMQLLTKALPRLEEINEDGESGRRKINQYTRLLTLPLSLIQSVGLLLLIRQQASSSIGIDITGSASMYQWALMITALTGGSMLLMWLGELMTEQGVGNGISLLIFAGIISQFPSIAGSIGVSLADSVGGQNSSDIFGLFTVPFNLIVVGIIFGFIVLTIFTTYFVVKLSEAQRLLTVSYAKRVRGNRAYGGVDTVLPIKLITAGVIPIIFAVAFLAVPSFAGQLMSTASTPWVSDLGVNLNEWFRPPISLGGTQALTGTTSEYVYPATYFLLVLMFTYFYTSIVFNAKQISENLQKQGGFVPGIRPGKQTENYLRRVVNRLNLYGALSLGFLALLPFFIERVLGTSQLTAGGTSVLIIVSVALETLRKIESRALMVSYDNAKY